MILAPNAPTATNALKTGISTAPMTESNTRPSRILVSLATYNERDNLAPLVNEIQKVLPDVNILVIDDNSPDGTGKIADELVDQGRQLHVMHRPGKLGLGTALMAAMKYAQERNYDFLLNMDADFSHPPRFLPGIIAGMDRHDVMIGSRYVAGGGTENWPWSRRLMSRSVNRLVRLLFRMPVCDASGSFRCYRVEKLKEVRLDHMRSRGYSFQQEVLFRCHKAGCSLGEFPIIFENRRYGSSKVNPREAVRSIGMILLIGMRNILGLEPKTTKADT